MLMGGCLIHDVELNHFKTENSEFEKTDRPLEQSLLTLWKIFWIYDFVDAYIYILVIEKTHLTHLDLLY